MKCPNCNTGTCIMVTKQNPNKVRERRGGVLVILLFPFFMIYWLFDYLFRGRKETYNKEMVWKCSYCGHSFPPAHATGGADTTKAGIGASLDTRKTSITPPTSANQESPDPATE